MAFSTDGLPIFFYTIAGAIFVITLLYIIRQHLRRQHVHYQQTHTADLDNPPSPTSRRRLTPAESKDRELDDILSDDQPSPDFDPDELDQLRALSLHPAKTAEGGDEEVKEEVKIDILPPRPAISVPTLPLSSPTRTSQPLSLPPQRPPPADEEKAAPPRDRHERAVV